VYTYSVVHQSIVAYDSLLSVIDQLR